MIFITCLKKIVINFFNEIRKKRKFENVIGRACRLLGCEYVTYSQNFEDLIAGRMLNVENGLYVDVGAHHPIKYSNTYQLYLKGWKGINIDPYPGCKKLFDKYRPNDVNLNLGIAEKKGMLKYYCFKEPAYNTTSQQRAKYIIDNGIDRMVREIRVRVVTLEQVFDRYLSGRKIDFMTIDVETMELSVLKSNNWSKYRPTLIVMESLESYGEEINKVYGDTAIRFLIDQGYIVVAKNGNAVFLKDAINK